MPRTEPVDFEEIVARIVTVTDELDFTEGTVPSGDNVYIVRDNSGDLTANVLTGKSLNIAVNGTDVFTIGSATLLVADDVLFRLGTDGDQVMLNRSTELVANTALTNALIATVVGATVPANSFILSNRTANGDIVLYTTIAGGSASIEAARIDSSAGLIVFNEASADWDFRIEGDNNANMVVLDGGTDSGAFGAAVVAGAFLTISGATVNRAGVTSVGREIHLPAATFTQTNANPTTLAIGSRLHIAIPTFDGSNAGQTITDAAT